MKFIRSALFSILTFAAFPASAVELKDGIAVDGQLGFQPPASPVMERIEMIHNHFLLVIITLTTLFVLGLILYVCVRFSRKNNPVPSKTSHHTMLEVVWTTIPVLILVAIAIPSINLHSYMNDVPEKVDLTIKAVGRQWYWEYEYPDNGVTFESRIVADKDLQPGQPRLLTVDNEIVVPVNKVVRVQLTGGDVIHAWAVPAFGVKMDAVPGKLNETWFEATRTGVFYGQCSELCGVDHGYMPIAVRVVEQADFDAWVASRKTASNQSAQVFAANKH